MRDGKMTEEGRGVSTRTWNAIAAGVFLLAVALGILIYMSTGDVFDTLWTILIVFGLYVGLPSVFKDMGNDNFGPSEADVSLVGGVILAGIGVSGLVYSFTSEVLYTVVVLIVIVAVAGIVMAIKNRNV